MITILTRMILKFYYIQSKPIPTFHEIITAGNKPEENEDAFTMSFKGPVKGSIESMLNGILEEL